MAARIWRRAAAFVDIDAGTLPGTTLSGGESGEHVGSALAGGFDITNDGHDDILAGSSDENAVYLYTGPGEEPQVFGYAVSNGEGDPGRPIGDDVAMIPDVNGDGSADVLLGSAGNAYLLFGGERLDLYAQNYVFSWTAQGQDGEQYQVVVYFDGSDQDGDGVLRGRGTTPYSGLEGGYANELDAYFLLMYKDDGEITQVAHGSQMKEDQFNLNFDLNSEQLLATGGSLEADGIYIGRAGR